jgi:phosphatidylglycerophosphate synthase
MQTLTIDNVITSGERLRARLFSPILILLDEMGLSADIITHLRLCLGGLFFAVFFFDERIGVALFVMTLVADSFDGALARFQGKASDRGKFLDLFVDQTVYFLMLMHCALSLKITSYQIVLNLFLVLASYVLATIFHAKGKRTDWILAPYPRLSFLKSVPIVAFLAIPLGANYVSGAIAISNIAGLIVLGAYYLAIQLQWHYST